MLDRWSLGIGLFAAAYANRVILSLVAGRGVVNDHRAVRYAWLYPLRDLMGFLFWCVSYTGRTIVWRGDRYRLEGCGRMVLVQPAAVGVDQSLPKTEVGASPAVVDRYS